MLLLGALYCVFLLVMMFSERGRIRLQRRTLKDAKESWKDADVDADADADADADVVVADAAVVALFPSNYRDAFLMDEDAKERSREVVRAQVRAAESAASEPLASRVASRNQEALELAHSRQRELKRKYGSGSAKNRYKAITPDEICGKIPHQRP